MRTHLIKAPSLLVLSAALLAAGCGGGGGGGAVTPAPMPGSPDPVAPAPVVQRSVSGVVAKGLIKKARVQAFALDAKGNKGATPIATGVTADDGRYTLTVPASALSFVVEIDAASGATMADEATGQELPFPVDMKLRTVVTLATADTTAVTSHVSPLTELVAKTAESAAGGLTAANIAQAKTGTIAALGFDPEQVKPVNSNSAGAASASQEERIQSLTLAAISKLAQDSKLGCDQPTPAARVSCVVAAVSKSGSLAGDKLSLNEAVRNEIRTTLATVAGNPAINLTGIGSVNGYPAFSQSVVPTVAGMPTGVASAKKLFASLRTNLQAWSDSSKKEGKMAAQYNALRSDFDKATAPLDTRLLSWVKLSARGAEFLSQFKAGAVNNATLFISLPGTGATCTVYSDAASTVKATSAANAANVLCAYQVFSGYVPGSYILGGNEIVITPVAGQTNSFTYKARALRSVQPAYGSSGTASTATVGHYGASTADRANGTISYTKLGATYTSVSIAGMMPARMDDAGNAITDNEVWKLNATRTVENSVATYAISGAVTGYVGGVADATFTVKEGSFVRVLEDRHDAVDDLVKEINLGLTAEAGKSKVTGTLHLENFAADKNGQNYVPAKVAFVGSVSNAGNTFFTGSLNLDSTGYSTFNSSLPLSSTNFVGLTLGMSGTFTMPGRPPLLLTGTFTDTSPTSAKEYVQYNDGAVVFTASRVVDGAADTIAIASSEGVSVKLGQTDTVDVLKDGAKVALINLKTGIITYADGVFESLK